MSVSVTKSGMHLITDADLRAMGFSDPSKVHVYGMGGRMLPEGLTERIPNDLPLLPSVRTAKGIVFFAADHFTWSASSGSSVPYQHVINPYCEKSLYFVSDREIAAEDMPQALTTGTTVRTATTFTERIVHERELQHPGESGRNLLGEDFRSTKSQKFSFDLPDNVDGNAFFVTSFGAKTTNGQSSLIFTANGTRLPSTASDRISSVSNADSYCVMGLTSKSVEDAGDHLDLTIDYSYSGALFTARLDYIEVFYERSLALRNGQLYFYGNFDSPTSMVVSGCSASTQIWDVTDHTAPTLVSYQLSGDKATFNNPGDGYREYVAFNPDQITGTATRGSLLANQNIHGMEEPDMLIITETDYMEGSKRIAKLHEEVDGFKVAILTPQQIYNEFSGGTADVSAFRQLLKMWRDRESERQISYCLIMGKPTFDPKGVSLEVKNLSYTPVPIWQSPTGLSETSSYSNDDFIGMLDDVDPVRMNLASAKCTIPIGRIPVTSASEALDVATKIENYVKNPEYGEWRNKVMLIADDNDNAVHFTQSEKVYNNLLNAGNGSNFLYDRLYLDSYKLEQTSVGPAYPKATERMLQNYNDGVIFTNYIGHASPTGWGHEHLWQWNDIVNMSNRNLTFMYAATCGFSFWDAPEESGAEHLILNPEGGVIGMMAATRTVYISQNGTLNDRTTRHYFERDAEGKAKRLGNVYIEGKNDTGNDTNKLRYAFIGDPALRVLSPDYSAEITTIDGVSVLPGAVVYPEVKALGTPKVEGRILNPDGSLASDFNGTANLLLYDAERVITTYGNGDNGKSVTYNDRKTRLTSLNVKVVDGLFSGTLTLPPEIENNYSPARITVYAWDGKGREANGACDRLYVYGFNEDAAADEEGPVVDYIYLNNPNFENGGLVNSSPVFFAKVQDPSGINLSDTGIGHKMSVIVDGKQIFDNVSAYYTSDPETEGGGTISYPMTGLTAGKHTLVFTVWDNANNVTKQSLDFNVGAAVDPVIYDLSTDVNPASTSVVFRLEIDRPNTKMNCNIAVYDLNGRKIWENDQAAKSDINSTMTARWDLCDKSGARVPRGIYLYRATVESPEGTYTSKTKKLAVTGQ